MPETTKNALPPVGPSLSRREILFTVLAGGMGLASLPVGTHIAKASGMQNESVRAVGAPADSAPFVPENDYPFFGFEP